MSLWASTSGHWNFVTYKEPFIIFKISEASKCYYKSKRVTAVNSKALYDFSVALYLILLLKISCPCFLIIVKDKCLPSWGGSFYFLLCQFSFPSTAIWEFKSLNRVPHFQVLFPHQLGSFFPCSWGELQIMCWHSTPPKCSQ